jgi:urea carboxylase system permease
MTTTSTHDEAELGTYGYSQELHRSLGSFSSFAAGFSYISVLTGIIQLSGFGIAAAGPAVIWAFPIVFGGQLLVALCFAELAARYPITGSVYSWSARVGGEKSAWWAGYVMLVTDIVSVAAVALGAQALLPQIWSGFQIIGDGTGASYAQNAVLLGTVMIVFTTVVNIAGVRVMAMINNAGVFIELCGCVLLAILLMTVIQRGPSVVFDTFDLGATHTGGYLGAFAVGAIFPLWIYFGFDTAGSLAEETTNPRKRAPKAIIRALSAAGFLGTLLVLLSLMSARDLHSADFATGGVAFLVRDRFGSTVGIIFLCIALVAVTVCCLAIHTGSIRMMFAMGRDNRLPFSRQLARVDERSGAPIAPSIVVGVLAILILLVNIGQGAIVAALTSMAVALGYIAYLIVTATLLKRRLGGWPTDTAEARRDGHFTMGRGVGLAVNIAAVVYGAVCIVNVTWPRIEIYNATGPSHWYLQYFAYLFTAVLAVLGIVLYALRPRARSGADVEPQPLTTPHNPSIEVS